MKWVTGNWFPVPRAERLELIREAHQRLIIRRSRLSCAECGLVLNEVTHPMLVDEVPQCERCEATHLNMYSAD